MVTSIFRSRRFDTMCGGRNHHQQISRYPSRGQANVAKLAKVANVAHPWSAVFLTNPASVLPLLRSLTLACMSHRCSPLLTLPVYRNDQLGPCDSIAMVARVR